jgi:hypothetical protein
MFHILNRMTKPRPHHGIFLLLALILSGCGALFESFDFRPDCDLLLVNLNARVYDINSGEPIEGAAITIESVQTTFACDNIPGASLLTEPFVITTDSQGRFAAAFAVSPEDLLSMTIRAEDCQPLENIPVPMLASSSELASSPEYFMVCQ